MWKHLSIATKDFPNQTLYSVTTNGITDLLLYTYANAVTICTIISINHRETVPNQAATLPIYPVELFIIPQKR